MTVKCASTARVSDHLLISWMKSMTDLQMNLILWAPRPQVPTVMPYKDIEKFCRITDEIISRRK